jgi:hypothetical protein
MATTASAPTTGGNVAAAASAAIASASTSRSWVVAPRRSGAENARHRSADGIGLI